MESPFQVSLILYLDSIECVPRGKKERLNPSIRSGKVAQPSSLRDGLARLQRKSVNTQGACLWATQTPSSWAWASFAGGNWPTKGQTSKEVHNGPSEQGWTGPSVHSPFQNVINITSSPKILKHTRVCPKPQGSEGPHVSHSQTPGFKLWELFIFATNLTVFHMFPPGMLFWSQNTLFN